MTASTTKKLGDVKGVASKWDNGSRVHVQRSTSEYGKYIACRHVTVSFTETLFLFQNWDRKRLETSRILPSSN
jgi:hypothetical protein